MKLKLCGIRRKEDIEYINEFCPDYIGFVFAPSRRMITPENAAALNSIKRSDIKSVGVFVNSSVSDICSAAEISGIDVIQLHGDENAEYICELRKHTGLEIWKAVRVKTEDDISKAHKLGADKLLLDSFSSSQYGGTGKTADWNIIKRSDITAPFFVAGGINADNILSAVSELSPYGIDISGGIETDGVKDREKIKKIIQLLERNE